MSACSLSCVTSSAVMPLPMSGRRMFMRRAHVSSSTWARPATTRLTATSSVRAACQSSHTRELRPGLGRRRSWSSESPLSQRSETLAPETSPAWVVAWSWRKNWIRSIAIPSGTTRESDAELGIERVAQPVTQQVDAQRGEGQRGAGEGGQPPRDVEEVAALAQHAAPGRRGRLHAEAEKADGGLGHDELRELQTGHHDD